MSRAARMHPIGKCTKHIKKSVSTIHSGWFSPASSLALLVTEHITCTGSFKHKAYTPSSLACMSINPDVRWLSDSNQYLLICCSPAELLAFALRLGRWSAQLDAKLAAPSVEVQLWSIEKHSAGRQYDQVSANKGAKKAAKARARERVKGLKPPL